MLYCKDEFPVRTCTSPQLVYTCSRFQVKTGAKLLIPILCVLSVMRYMYVYSDVVATRRGD